MRFVPKGKPREEISAREKEQWIARSHARLAGRMLRDLLQSELQNIQNDWKNTPYINKQSLQQVEEKVRHLSLDLPCWQKKRPKCAELKELYEDAFHEYYTQLIELDECRKDADVLIKELLDHVHYIEKAREDLKRLDRLLKTFQEFTSSTQNNEYISSATRAHILFNYELSSHVRTHKDIASRIDDYKRSDIEKHFPECQKLKKELDEYSAIIEDLLKPTHEWEISEVETVTVEPPIKRPAEHPKIIKPEEKMTIAKKKKCVKCQRELRLNH